jgi:two-component system phosphate regulon response regulator PhoB
MSASPPQRILVVDDEKDATDLLTYQLENGGYEVAAVNRPREALGLVRTFRPALLLLDIMMPEMSGYQVCERLKEDPELARIPVVFLTARGEPDDRVRGFESGVDDYIAKPFHARELLLRIRAILKRAEVAAGASNSLRVGKLLLDKDLQRLEVDGAVVEMTTTEFRLLQVFLERRDEIVPREDLLARVWNYRSTTETRTVDTHVRRLREKLGPYALHLETVRGIGYRFLTPAAEPTDPGSTG